MKYKKKTERKSEATNLWRIFLFGESKVSVVDSQIFASAEPFLIPWMLVLKYHIQRKRRRWNLYPTLLKNCSFYKHFMSYYWLKDITMKRSNPEFFIHHKLLVLNFYKKRFFPLIRTLEGHTYSTSSLGMFSKFFNKGKNFIRSKSSFLVSAGFLRKILIYSGLVDLMLVIKKTPLYLSEILNTIHNPAIPFYNHPFHNISVDEALILPEFRFNMILFFNNKNYGEHKTKCRGRLKRKISRRLQRLNRVLD